MSLSSKQIRELRSESHRLNLKPVVMIGQNGLSENVINECQQALQHHELIKIRIPALDDKAEKKDFINQICQITDATLIQSIGHVIVIYRQNPKVDRFRKCL